MRITILVLLLSVGFASAAEPAAYPYPNHVHTLHGVRAYSELDGTQLVPPSVSFTTMRQGRVKVAAVVNLSDPTTPLYLNGVKYDYENRVEFADPYMDEIGRWYAFTGYFAVTRRPGGGWNFDTLEGKEEKALWDHNMQFVSGPQAKKHRDLFGYLGHTGITKDRVKTLAECRDLWKRELSGEIKYDEANLTYRKIAPGKRIPLTPILPDPRSIPIIRPEI